MSSWFTRKKSPLSSSPGPNSSPKTAINNNKWNKLNKAMNNSSKKVCLYSRNYAEKIIEILRDYSIIDYYGIHDIKLSNIVLLLIKIELNSIVTPDLSDNYLLEKDDIKEYRKNRYYEDPAQRFKDWVTLSHEFDKTVKMALDAAFSRNTKGLNAKQKMDIMSKLETAKREFCTEIRMKSLQNSLPNTFKGGKRTRRKHHKTRKHRR